MPGLVSARDKEGKLLVLLPAILLVITGVARPGERYAGKPVQPITGRDLSPLLAGEPERVYGADDAVDLAGSQPVIFQRMLSRDQLYQRDNGVLPFYVAYRMRRGSRQ